LRSDREFRVVKSELHFAPQFIGVRLVLGATVFGDLHMGIDQRHNDGYSRQHGRERYSMFPKPRHAHEPLLHHSVGE
jgi:hypothetical protein